MIPLRLSLKNFMCYRDNLPPLELEGIHVACLCGANGHGKTALLDAITWVLWGQARAKTQEELIHQGQLDMAVELEFMAREQRYRVSRKHSRAGRSRQGTTLLELNVASNGSFRPITGNSVRETEGKIRDLLHMDYETFINSAFLLQGRADLFTTSSPAERKEVLGKILDLSSYDQLEAKAKERSKDLDVGIHATQVEIQGLERDAEKRPEYEAQLAQVNSTLEQITPQVEGYKLKLEGLRRSLDSLHTRERELDGLKQSLDSSHKEVTHFEEQARTHQDRVGRYEEILQRRDEIQKGASKLKGAQESLERLNALSGRFSSLSQEKVRVESEVRVQSERIVAEMRQIEARIQRELEPKANRRETTTAELAKAQERLSEAEKGEEALKQRREQLQALSLAMDRIKTANAKLYEEMEGLRTRFDLLQLKEAQCPLCKQPLGPEGKEHLRSEYEAQGREKKRAYLENETETKRLDEEHKRATGDVSRLEAELLQRRRLGQARITALERDLEEAKAAEKEKEASQAQLQGLQDRLNGGHITQEERKKLAEVEQELSILGYDADEHQSVQNEAKTLEPYADLHRRLLEAEEMLPKERQELQWANDMIESRRQTARESLEKQATLQEELRQLPDLRSQLGESEDKHKQLSDVRDSYIREQGALDQRLREYARSEEELKHRRQELRKRQDEKSIYDELALAFGKNGIQALIVENAIPQLENEANELLARLTDNRMSLKLETQRERRTRSSRGSGRGQGELIETLEIKIADELGTRSYETFSGGETFRINFALRIALSRLLARRAGAPLPTLFIDEGFGTQDSSGRERLLEAIKSVEKDFEKIFVITHIEELKDAFPVRIEVTKTEAGSTFTVV